MGSGISSGLIDIAQSSLADVHEDLEGAGSYANEAASYMLGPQGGADTRLTTRRFPFDSIDEVPGPTQLSVGRIAQMHTAIAPYVGEILVEFAADTNMNGLVDVDSEGRISWYGLGRDTNGDGVVNASDIASWPNPASGGPSYNPVVTTSANRHLYVWRHGDIGQRSAWPYMVRIRYRIADSKGELTGPDGLPGRPMEHVLYVQRN